MRSIYRYVEEMICAGIPIDIARGAQGGIYISDAYKLTKGLMTKEEYGKAIEAMLAMQEQTGDPALKSAVTKLSAHVKSEKIDLTFSGHILVDSGTWGDERRFSEKLALMEQAIESCEALEIDYADRGGERTHRVILPHLLVYKQNIWYIYAWCRMRESFRLFKLGRIRTVLKTGETFERVPFTREDVPLAFWQDFEHSVEATFEISPEAFTYAVEWLGVENLVERDGKYFAEVVLPDDESLLGKILSVGAGFKVLSPASLAERVRNEAKKIAELSSPQTPL